MLTAGPPAVSLHFQVEEAALSRAVDAAGSQSGGHWLLRKFLLCFILKHRDRCELGMAVLCVFPALREQGRLLSEPAGWLG